MSQLTDGILIFLVTEIEDGARLWEQDAQTMQNVLIQHDMLVRGVIKAHQGKVFRTVGTSFYAVFESAALALTAALESQLALLTQEWAPSIAGLRVLMALHSGVARERDGSYFGSALNHVAALLDGTHGGQILLSQTVKTLLEDHLKPDLTLFDLGEQRLRDLTGPEHLFQLVAAGLPTEFPPQPTLTNLPNNLPIQTFELVGREKEIAQACGILKQKQLRLLTFTGPGGTGKTSLSLQVAANLLVWFQDGVFFLDLSATSQPKQIISEVAKLFNLKESSGSALIETLKQQLRSKQILLVLDNFEQLVAGASLVSELLTAAPGLKLIVSSRERLRVFAEQEFVVYPLAIPDLSQLPPYAELITYPAIILFAQRAQLIKPDFQLNAENAQAVAEICVQLDGLPLAIELAAARSDGFTPQEMLEQFTNRLKVLIQARPDLPTRQQSLRGAIEWGYSLLDKSSQIVFTRLAVFNGGCTTEAAEAVCNPDDDPEIDILSSLTALVDKNLLRRLEVSTAEHNRFVMLETIREYALEQLALQGEEEQWRQQHAAYYIGLAEEAEPYLTGPQQVEWFQRLEQEHSNIRVVMNWALEGPKLKAEVALPIGAALWRFWDVQGYLNEGRYWLEKALSARVEQENQTQAQTIIRAKAFNAAGILARDQGDYEHAINLLRESLALQRELGEKQGIASTLNTLGTVQANLGNYSTALAFHQETLALRRELNDERGVAISLCNLAALTFAQDNYEQSITLYQEALVLLRQLGDKRTIARVVHNLGHTMLVQGDLLQARAWIEESLVLRRELNDKPGIADSLILLAEVTGAQGRPEEALKLYQESLKLLQEVGDNLNIAACLEGIAGTLSSLQKPESAAQLYGAAEQLREVIGAPVHPADRPRYEQSLVRIKNQLSSNRLEAAWTAGRAMSLEQVIAIANL